METGNVIAIIILVFLLLILAYFLMREVTCWYFKINKRIDLMEENNRLLRSLINSNSREFITPQEKDQSKKDSVSNEFNIY